MKQEDQVYSTGRKRYNCLLVPYFASLCSLLLCCAMFFGTTYAWFTANVSSTGNRIDSGTLTVDLIHKETSLKENAGHPVFTDDVWMPGSKIRMETVKLCNTGTLPLRYKLDFVQDTTLGSSSGVTDLFQVYVKAGEITAQDGMASSGDQLDSTWTSVGTLTEVMAVDANNNDTTCLIQSAPLNPADPDVGWLAAGDDQPISIALWLKGDSLQVSHYMGEKVALFLNVVVDQNTEY